MAASSDFAASGKLVLVPTPIGNLGDITLRAVDALKSADVIYAEDTRVTGNLLRALDIEARSLKRLDENVLSQKVDEVADAVSSGKLVAFCSDAGMPGVSDPGIRLVSAFRESGLPVEVLPGASAAATAYVASGMDGAGYYFGGFLPRKASERVSFLSSLASLDAPLVFYESPKRLVSALESVAEVFPERDVAVCRELTKLHEEVAEGPVAEILEMFSEREAEAGIKGEIALVVSAPTDAERSSAARDSLEAARERAFQLVKEGVSQKGIAKQLVAELGISRNDAYDISLEAKG